MAKEFLPNVSVARLRSMQKKEKNPKVRDRLLACMHRKQGKTLVEISDTLNVPRSTVTDWMKRIGRNGLSDMYDVKNKGAACKLSKRQLKALDRDLEAGPAAVGLGAGAWTIPLIRMHIKKKFRVEYHVHSVWSLVRRLGFVHIKPRPRDVRGASPAEIKAFKKKAHRTVVAYAGRGYLAVSLDEMHVNMQSVVRKSWYKRKGSGKRAEQVRVDVTGRRSGRTTLIGIVAANGRSYFEFCDTGNAENVEAFLTRAYKKMGKLLVYTDNASYHSEAVFKRLYEKTGGGIVVRFLPKYTPELAPIEAQWREVKRYIADMFFDDIEQLKKAVKDGFRRGRIKIVKMYDYLVA